MRRCLAFALLAPVAASAQAIEPGIWPGSVQFAEGDSAAVRFVITMERDRTLIDVTAPNGTVWTLGEVRADSTRLRFAWAIDGPQAMQCDLSRRSATYWEGHCQRRPDRVLVTLRRGTT